MRSSLIPLLLCSAGAVAQPRHASESACASVNSIIQINAKTNSTATAKPIPGQMAYDCLKSIPYDSELGKAYIKDMLKYVQFQSTLEVLKTPPKGYEGRPVDIEAGLRQISDKNWDSQYDFDMAVYNLVSQANDGHFTLVGCSMQILGFVRGRDDLVSVSKDGVAKPELYLLQDMRLLTSGNGTASPVAKINNQDPADYLEGSVARYSHFQDADARWNNLFASIARQVASPGQGDGEFINKDQIWPGSESTVVQLKNGTKVELETTATPFGTKFSKNPAELFKHYCLPSPPTNSSSSGSGSPDTPVPPPLKKGPLGFPKPTFRDAYNNVVGYYADVETAVMFIPTFESPEGVPTNHSSEVYKVVQDIIQDAVASGRSKIIIDVTGNPGGNINRGFSIFKLFFPDGVPYSETRFRRHDASEGLATIFGSLNESLSFEGSGPFGYKSQVTPNQKDDFGSVSEFLGDTEQLGVKLTSPFANSNLTEQHPGDPIIGYGPAAELLPKAQPFKAEDILIVGDGTCTSTCTTFVNLMTNVGNVRTVAFGGRPNQKAMQIMGGVRGAQSATFDLLALYASRATEVFQKNSSVLTDKDEIARISASLPRPMELLPLRYGLGNLNLRNAYQEGKPDLPLQFEYQAADCRLFYTAENILSPASIWASAKKAVWGNSTNTCVRGSTGGTGSQQDRESHKGGDGNEKGNSGRPNVPDSAAGSISPGWLGALCLGASVLAALG